MNNRGFTFIESLIAIILLSICLTGGLALYFGSKEIMTLATHKRIAMEMANQLMEEYKEDGYDALPSATGLWGSQETVRFGDFSAQRRRRISDVIDGASIQKQVEVEVRWFEAGKSEARSVRLMTQLASL